MTITLNHTIVPAVDNRQAARFFATIMGLPELPRPAATGTSPRYGSTNNSPSTS
ncbi:unnamed protein product [[Actinomadura] parvosata subsp. kistnae]|uniref:hypothetical protein n=1 Tax=[Actinomadura] parvosata TaxID=1955412 RepID=UPI000D2A217E|nr:unnamed protein product [Actinomadura parvosata subsp. kistnae]